MISQDSSAPRATATAPERSSPKFHPAVEAGVARGKPPWRDSAWQCQNATGQRFTESNRRQGVDLQSWSVCDTGSRDQAHRLGLQFPCAYHRFLGVLDPDRTSKSYLGSVVSNNGRQSFHDIALWSTPSGSLNQLKQPCRMTYVDWCSYDLFKHAGLCQMLHDPDSTTTMPLTFNHPALNKSQERKMTTSVTSFSPERMSLWRQVWNTCFCAPRFSQLQSSSTLHTQDRVFFSRPPRLIIPTQLQQPRHQEIEMCVPDQAIHGWTCMLSCYNALGFKILKMPKSPQLTKQIQGKMAEIWWGYRVIVRRSQRLPWSSGERLVFYISQWNLRSWKLSWKKQRQNTTWSPRQETASSVDIHLLDFAGSASPAGVAALPAALLFAKRAESQKGRAPRTKAISPANPMKI